MSDTKVLSTNEKSEGIWAQMKHKRSLQEIHSNLQMREGAGTNKDESVSRVGVVWWNFEYKRSMEIFYKAEIGRNPSPPAGLLTLAPQGRVKKNAAK